MTDTLKNFRETIKHRRALYRSLQRRGLIQGDPSLRSLDGSIYAKLVDAYQRGRELTLSPVELAHICERCHMICKDVYNADSGLTEPERWPAFLDVIAQTAQDPERHDHQLFQTLETDLSDFATELMALQYTY